MTLTPDNANAIPQTQKDSMESKHPRDSMAFSNGSGEFSAYDHNVHLDRSLCSSSGCNDDDDDDDGCVADVSDGVGVAWSCAETADDTGVASNWDDDDDAGAPVKDDDDRCESAGSRPWDDADDDTEGGSAVPCDDAVDRCERFN